MAVAEMEEAIRLNPQIASALRGHTLRLAKKYVTLDLDQAAAVELIVGEAFNNAALHSLDEGETIFRIENLMGGFSLTIANPSDGFPDKYSVCENGQWAESGRGCKMIQKCIEDLSKSFVQVFGNYRFEPDQNNSERGRTIFSFLICRG